MPDTDAPAAEETTTTSDSNGGPAGDGIYAPATNATTTTETPGTTGTTQAAATMEGLSVAETSAGEHLVDAEGNTLYLFLPDEQGDSTCYDGCASNWPPLAGPIDAADGVDADLISTAARDDGTEQVTYNGWPLYYYAADSEPGDTNGQGVSDVWFVVDAAGEPIGG